MSTEGIPDGWELVRIGQVFHQEDYINAQGEIERWRGRYPSLKKGYVIVQKAVKPKQYRPFANAAEFAPHKKRWLTHPENTVIGEFQVVEFNDNGIWCRGMDDLMPYERAYGVGLRFDDGTPFGIEVTE